MLTDLQGKGLNTTGAKGHICSGIGHLFTRKVINQKIVLVCVQQLLSGNIQGTAGTSVHENCIECACELLSLTAKLLGETPKAVPLVESYFSKFMNWGTLQK